MFSTRFFQNVRNYISRVMENYLEYNSKPLGIILQVTPDTPEPKSAQNPKIFGYRVYEMLPAPSSPEFRQGKFRCVPAGCAGRKVSYLRAQKELGGQPVHRYITYMPLDHLAPPTPTRKKFLIL